VDLVTINTLTILNVLVDTTMSTMIMTVTAQILDVDVCVVFSDNVTNEARKVRKNS